MHQIYLCHFHPTSAADLDDQEVKLHKIDRKTRVLVFRKTDIQNKCKSIGELHYWVIRSVDFFLIHCIKSIVSQPV